MSADAVSRYVQLSVRLFLLPLMRRTLPLFFALIFAFGMVDHLSMPSLLKADIARQPWYERSLAVVVFIGLWSVMLMPALRVTLREPGVRWLQRQPISHGRWLFLLGPAIVPLCLPLVYPAYLFALPGVSGAESVGTVLLALGVTIHRFTCARTACKLAFAGCGIVAVVLDQTLGLWGLPVLVAGLSGLALPLRFRYGQAEVGETSAGGRVRATRPSPIHALITRDFLAARAANRRWLVQFLSWLLPASALLWALKNNGQLAPRPLLVALCILFAVTSIPVMALAESVRLHLGTHFLQRRWPITVLHRWQSLLLACGLLCGSLGFLMLLVVGRMPAAQMTNAIAWIACVAALVPLIVTWRFTRGYREPGEASYLLALITMGLLLGLPSAVQTPVLVCLWLVMLWTGLRLLYRWRKRK